MTAADQACTIRTSPRPLRSVGSEATRGWLPCFQETILTESTVRPSVQVYVDGFNLYYRALKGTPYRWLDPGKLARFAFPGYDVRRIRYFTARLDARPFDPGPVLRQQAYLTALNSVPNLTVHEGLFRTRVVRMRRACPVEGESPRVEVLRTEEKGSDVNLAIFALWDAIHERPSLVALITNDSDQKQTLQFIRQGLGLDVVVLNPDPRRPSADLKAVATEIRPLRPRLLAACQFPPTVTTPSGRTVRKPERW